MQLPTRILKCGVNRGHSASAIGLSLSLALALVLFGVPSALAQTFKVIHSFQGIEGSNPFSSVNVGGQGILYGSAALGGVGHGVTFELKQDGAEWEFIPRYEFTGGADGDSPYAVVQGPDGALYGTTGGGGNAGLGTVFRLDPAALVCTSLGCLWKETVLYSFSGADGANPDTDNLVFDQAGNIYGATSEGGVGPFMGNGVAYELSRSGNNWIEIQSYKFLGGSIDGFQPSGGLTLTFDSGGNINIYGVTAAGGSNFMCTGIAYEIAASGQTWMEQVIHRFEVDPPLPGLCNPLGTLAIDARGNLYGAAARGIFELSPPAWNYGVLNQDCVSPGGGLTMDSAGNFFGVCNTPAFVYKLSYNGQWIFQDLHDFSGDDGAAPVGQVAIDADGNLFGAASYGGNPGCQNNFGCGTIWEITGAAAPDPAPRSFRRLE